MCYLEHSSECNDKMWRIGVLLVATVFIEFAAGDVKPTDTALINRLKRSPNSCENYDYRPRYWPPPPPPPPPPPGPPPPYWPPPPPGPPPFWRHHHHRDRFEDFRDDGPKDEPCPTCQGDGVSSSLSNAKSVNGDAIAVAIAKASPKT